MLDYVLALLGRSRTLAEFSPGLSPRAGLGLLKAARAWAFVDGRDYVWLDDVQAVLEPVAAHRLDNAADGVRRLLKEVAVP